MTPGSLPMMRRKAQCRFVAFFVIVILCALNGRAYCQHYSADSRRYFDYGDPFYSNVIESADGSHVTVLVNTASNMFSFLHVQHPDARGSYYALRELSIEIERVGSGEVVQSGSYEDTIFVRTYDASISRTSWHPTVQVVALPTHIAADSLIVRVRVRDGVLNRAAMLPKQFALHTVGVGMDTNGIGIGDIVLLAQPLIRDRAPVSMRGNLLMFGQDFDGLISFRLPHRLYDAKTLVELQVRQLSDAVDPIGFDSVDGVNRGTQPADLLVQNTKFSLQPSDSAVGLTIVGAGDSDLWTARFHVDGKGLDQGRYQLTARVHAGGAVRTYSRIVELAWLDMPLSLQDIRSAISPMSYIVPDDTLSAINSGSDAVRRANLFQYWKAHDPTPATAYNERMAAFFQRVDYADFNFSESHLLDGAMTDRGKIYILFGAPTKIQRELLPGEAPTEIWTYTNAVAKQFRFEAHGGGNEYRLISVTKPTLHGQP